MKKRKKLIALLLSAALAVSVLPTAVFAAATVSCAESGCSGTYDNGFCTMNDSHYQAATQVSSIGLQIISMLKAVPNILSMQS